LGWGQGLNRGASRAKLVALEDRLAALHRQHGQKVVLIGWSLGGLYARVLGQRMPEAIELVMTVGSPFSGDRHANRAWRLYELINDHTVDNPPFAEDLATKPAATTIAVWSAVDGVVAPVCAMGSEEQADRRIRPRCAALCAWIVASLRRAHRGDSGRALSC
jgi:pimeloyl-ACP methyl ester carboxylesterase